MKTKRLFDICTYLLLLSIVPVFSAQQQSDKIVFLYLSMINDSIIFQKTEIVDGKLKTRRAPSAGDISYKIYDSMSSVLQQGAMPAPDILYHDAPVQNSNQLTGKVTKLDSVNFVVRLPYNPNYAQADFFANEYRNTLSKRVIKKIGSFPLTIDKK